MEAKAVVKFVRISPMKVSVVLDLIRNKPISEARAILKATPKAASPVLIKAARLGRRQRREQPSDEQGFALCGVRPRRPRRHPETDPAESPGSAYRIAKRTSHITMVLKEKE